MYESNIIWLLKQLNISLDQYGREEMKSERHNNVGYYSVTGLGTELSVLLRGTGRVCYGYPRGMRDFQGRNLFHAQGTEKGRLYRDEGGLG